uniref:DNA-directed DNA polymerase n=1 Tax=Globodera rostochiensis TaxID=31243 RepID=A0A914I3T2_GLORO
MASSNLFLKAINDIRKEDGVRELGTILAPKGKLSLFYALELARNYQMIGNENTNDKFRYFMKQEKKQQETVSELMRKLELDGNEKKYGIEKLESVQAFWDTAFPGMFRIVAFDVRAGLKPIFKGNGVRKYEVCVIANKGHWDGIKSAKRFFNVRNYCVSCEVSYDRPERHSIESHKKQACKEYKKCKKCGEVSQTRSKHVCGGKFCKLCKIYHQGRQCHIQKIRQKQILPRYRIVAYDMETTANEAGEHIPNLISAIVTCSECEGQKKNTCEAGYEKFVVWYEENKNSEFELGEQLKIYCENDDTETPNGFDILKSNITIASAAMGIFRAKFLKERHIPIVSEGGYEKADNQSVIAVKYFEWLAHRDGVKVRHACNGGEVQFGGYKVDCVIGEQKKIIEFQGCAFHGCPRCYRPWTKSPDGKSMEEKLLRTEMKMDNLRELCKSFSVEEVWECDVRAELRRNREMKKFFESVPDKGPINPRDAYGGGRTMPFCLYAQESEEEEISMFDIISLYPAVNYDTPYPVGVPKIVKRDEDVLWTEPDDVPYDGLLKVKVISPKKLKYPLLPVHLDDMLLFPNCGKCAKNEKKDFLMLKDVKKCRHSSEERAILGTFTSIELKKALELGYRVIHFYRAYHFEAFDTQLFKGYVRMFLKIKVEASGWPAEVKTEEEKRVFIAIMEEWQKILQDDKLETSEPIMLKDKKTMRVSIKKKEAFVVEHRVSNIILSLWTTSAARIKLYEYMEQVYRTKGCKLLYCDTDSLIFTHPRGVCPLKEGKFLGEMTREYADNEILEFVSGGPKQYSLKLRSKTNGKVWQKTKIRGITQTFNNKIDFEELKSMILEYKEGETMTFHYPGKFGPKRDGRIISEDLAKDYKPVQKKGIIDQEWNVLPFGYF